ncbi:DUF5068 domain-containing protein [Terribacillus saccharophilus]|uniref:DUF5068 domain-containing protein n=1 Tax=Terribacillus saccharophilus TaxID=361277 RepID=UPI0039819B3C
MNKKLMFLFGAIFSVLIISGCGADSKEASKEEEPAASEEKASASEENTASEDKANAADTATDVKAESDASKSEDAAATDSGSADIQKIVDFMKTNIEAEETTVFYENSEPQTHDMEGVNVTLDSYALVGVKDFHMDYSIPFDDETNGGIVYAHYTIKNDTDKSVYYNPSLDMNYSSGTEYERDNKDLVPEEDQLFKQLFVDRDTEVKAGETVKGYAAYPLGTAALETVMGEGSALIDVPVPQAKKDEFSNPIGSPGKFTINFDEEGAAKTESNKEFYQDATSVDNMGEKKMLEQKDGIGESQELGDTTVTLEGYQFTEFTPNEVEAPRFEDFNGVVLLTVKFGIDNKTGETVPLSGLDSTLTVDDSWRQLNEGMLTRYATNDVVKDGESGELLQVYVLDKEEYDALWKEKSYKIEIGPIRNEEAKDISKGKEAAFQLK